MEFSHLWPADVVVAAAEEAAGGGDDGRLPHPIRHWPDAAGNGAAGQPRRLPRRRGAAPGLGHTRFPAGGAKHGCGDCGAAKMERP